VNGRVVRSAARSTPLRRPLAPLRATAFACSPAHLMASIRAVSGGATPAQRKERSGISSLRPTPCTTSDDKRTRRPLSSPRHQAHAHTPRTRDAGDERAGFPASSARADWWRARCCRVASSTAPHTCSRTLCSTPSRPGLSALMLAPVLAGSVWKSATLLLPHPPSDHRGLPHDWNDAARDDAHTVL
jgi:hypothetical protein